MTEMSQFDEALEKNKLLHENIKKFYPEEEYWIHRVKLNMVIILFTKQ